MFLRFLMIHFCFCFLYGQSEEILIPRDVIFGNPSKTLVRLSPDGKYISYLSPENGILNLWIAPKNDPENATAVTHDVSRGIRQYYWTYDHKHLLYLQDYKGDENFKLYSYNTITHEHRLLTPDKEVKTVIFGASQNKPNNLLIGLNNRDPQYFDVYELNLKKGTLKLILENNKYSDIIVDNNLNIRFGILINDEGDQEIFKKEKNEWKKFLTIPMEDGKTSSIIGFNKNNSLIYVLDSRDHDTAVLKTLNLKTNQWTTLATDPRADIEPFALHPTKKTIQAISVNYDKPSIEILDPSIQKDIEYLKTLHQGFFNIVSRTLDDQTWIVAYADDISSSNYYLYDRKNNKTEFLFSGNPQLEKYPLAPMTPVIIQARDGLNLVCYLTRPANTETPTPLVLCVHGGPWTRDYWGVNPTHQWLANRGYAVLSVNYRGSKGFGKKFVNAGNLEWSGKMHDDLIDSVHWAIQNKIADPQKIGIMGGSYGGYATLVGLTFTPDLFACGVDIVGPSNLITLCQSLPPYWKPGMSDIKKRIGDWDSEEGKIALKNRSPLTFVNNIKKPLLIAQGAHDPRVKQAEADQIVEEMQKKQIPVIYALYPSEGHGFANPRNRISFYALTEQFFKDILGGRAEPIGDDLKGSDFILNGENNPSPEMAETIIKKNIVDR
jgi:dipeptidyl aminopeptidase/acylaminoacyl peptidase